MMRHRFKEYNDLFSFNQAFLGRSRGIGRISARAASASGLTGPNARASGLDFDIRKWSPYAAYGSVDFDVMLGADGDGDSHGRYMIRIREIVQSMEIVQQCSEILPTGKSSGLRADDSPHIPSGEAWSRIESARGLLACHVISDGGERPIRVHFRSASRAGLDLLPQLLQGARSEDLPVLLASLDLNLAEIDR
jgi:NADH-quinone oxidoreductase subunit D